MAEPEVDAGPTAPLATIGRRFAARLIDGIIITLPGALILARYVDTDASPPVLDAPLWLQAVVALLLPVAYDTLLIAWRGQTIGKVTMGIRVARVSDDGLPTIWQAGIRALLPIAAFQLPIPLVSLGLGLAIYLVAFGHPLRQGFHDRAAGTVVLSTR